MPKSAKRRKEKAADFAIQQEQKAKLKLGKGKQAPSNAIDTSFKARSIALPSQSIAVEKDDSAPTTRRKLSLDDLIVNIKHHNPDTIFGFRELLDAHWELIDSSLPILINVTVRIIGDEDASVRKALLSFYSWLIPRIPKEDLVPHAPLILLFTTSAQTHIFPAIRIDAIRFLNIFLEYFPEVIVRGWDTANNSSGSRVLEGYLGVLSAGTITGDAEGPPVATSTASVMLTPAASAAIEELQIMLGYMAAFFPFHSNGRKDVKIEQTFQDLNFTYCDLTSRLVPASRTSAAASHPTTSRGKKARHFGNDASQANRVQEYVLEILQEQVSSSQLVRGLTSTAYNSLLPTIWSLLNYSGRNEEQLERSGEVLEAVVEHAVKIGSKSALKRSTFDFVARLVLLETDVRYQGAFRLQTSTKADKLIEEWLTQLPQILWELGSSNPSVSEAIILILLRLLQRRSKILHENTLASLQTRFAPYFHITHPTRGEILGPFNKLPKNGLRSPSGLRRRVLDVVILLCTGGSSGEVLRSAVDSALVNTEEYEYWAHLKHHFGRSQTAL
ncbi:hypothetical protein HHX47_DHR1001836 [Lentinula edodes]|nr:hypothetical protein HHX47_DHR1001836 [Lentinula edodes]